MHVSARALETTRIKEKKKTNRRIENENRKNQYKIEQKIGDCVIDFHLNAGAI